jgi:periplasmic copper chaperone A
MPKPGWAITVRQERLAKPYDNHGTLVTQDVAEITWTATTHEAYLPDNFYDEFVLRGKAPAEAGPLWFKVTQQCQDGAKQGQNAWVEVPESGVDTKGLKFPAALLQVTATPTAAATLGTAASTTADAAPVHKH